MYRREKIKLPVPIQRSHYVDAIFDLGHFHDLTSETLVNAVLLGDYFVNYTGIRTPYINYTNRKLKHRDLLENLVPQHYSHELAYVVTLLSAKLYEDGHEINIKLIAEELQNYFVYKMEWEICLLTQFNVRFNNFISEWALILGPISNHFGSWIWDLTHSICLNQHLLQTFSFTLLLAVKLLFQKNKLRCLSQNNERIFSLVVADIAHEYDISISELLKLYITEKKRSL